MTVAYFQKYTQKVFEADNISLNSFKEFLNEFLSNELYTHYDLFVYGAFSSYLLGKPQWKTSDVDLFIGRVTLIDTYELSGLMNYLLNLAERHRIRITIKYFPEHTAPSELVYGTTVPYLTTYQKIVVDGHVSQDLTKETSLLDKEQDLYLGSSLYQITEKDIIRNNNGCFIYQGVNLRNYFFNYLSK